MNSENDEPDTPSKLPGHMFNAESHPAYIRFGVPLYLAGTLALLVSADVGAGVSADLQLSGPDGTVEDYGTLLEVSIISSVGELWHAGSYPLAILVVITSVSWPYVKLLLAVYSWISPIRKASKSKNLNRALRQRESLVEWIDLLDKWSFVDVFVMIIMMVAFRSTIEVSSGIKTDVLIVPKWGFFGFVVASVLSLLASHFILYRHRLVMATYKEKFCSDSADNQDSDKVTRSSSEDADEEKAREEEAREEEAREEGEKEATEESTDILKKTRLVNEIGISPPLSFLCILLIVSLTIAGAVLVTVTFTYTTGEIVQEVKSFSTLSIGADVPKASLTPNDGGIRFLQTIYYILSFVTPLLNLFLWLFLLFVPMSRPHQHFMFAFAEKAMAWSSIEVYVISNIFSVLQIPDFGTGIVDTGCSTCYVVDADLDWGNFVLLCVGAVLNVTLSFWFCRRSHSALYHF